MRNQEIFAPFFMDTARRDASVLAVALPMQRAWREYWAYCYIWGMGPNLNKVPRHSWHSSGSANEQLARVQRLVEFLSLIHI